MDVLAASDIFLFEDFRLDRRGGLFRRDDSGAFVSVAIGSRALDILGVLVERAGETVSKDEIVAAVWPGIVVEDSNLTVQISALRRVLDRGRSNGSCIQTVSGRGYRFVEAVTHPDAKDPVDASAIRDAGDRARDARPAAIIAREPTRAEDSSQRWRRVLNVLAAPAVIRYLSARTGDRRRSGRPGPPPLSIIVLPLLNLSGRPDQQYFADRITDGLTTDLSRFTGMRVISRSTAFTYRNKPVDAKQIGRELGVRYILEGSVQRFPNHLRVNIQLIDAESDMHVWAERFDGNPGDLFGVQSEITKPTAVSLYQELIGLEAFRPTEYPDALEYVLRGRAATLFKPQNREGYTEAINLFERALALDPNCAEAQGFLASDLAYRALDEMADAAAADIARAEALAARALAASPRNAFPRVAKGHVLSAQGRYKEAIAEYETASAINPGWPHLYGHLGDCKLWTGSIEETIPLAEQAIRLSPRDYLIASWYFSIGRVHLLQSRTDEAIRWLEKTRGANSGFPSIHAWLASAYALNGEIERAAAELAQAERLSSDGRYSSIARLKDLAHFGAPNIRALLEDTYLSGLRKAGMPEE